jgi:D-3-phosphoglycerate dehydrogenase / 2-oxoglutarate reductase
VLVHDPYVQLTAEDLNASVEHVSFDDMIGRSDIVTMHARVTPETSRMMNAEAFTKMKRGAIFINTARGPLADYDALYESLISGHLGGAMLETFAIEPVPADWPLLQLDNVTITPHIAGASVRTVTFAAEQAAEEVRRYLAGLPPINPC